MRAATEALPERVDLALLTPPQQYVWLRRKDLRKDSEIGDPARLRDFLCWWYTRGVAEYPGFADHPTEAQYAALVAPALVGSLEAPPISHFLLQVWRARSDLAAVYPLDNPIGRRGFIEWVLFFGRREVPVQDLWIDRELRDWLLAEEPEMPPVPRLAVHLWKTRADLQEACDVGTADGRQRLVEWFREHGVGEHRLGWLKDEPADPRRYVPPTGVAAVRAKRFAPPSQDEGVNLVGFATAEFGLGEDLRMAAKALAAAGIPFSVFEVPAGPGVHRRDLSVSRSISNELPYRTSMLCMAPFEAADFYLNHGRDAVAGRTVIGCWPWELPHWPANWAGVFELVQEIWAPSRYTQAAFAEASRVPVLHMPMAVDLPPGAPQPRARFALRDGVFQFLLVFDWNSWPARKNPAAALEAFRLAFPTGRERVGLAVKMIGLEPWSEAFTAVKALAETDSRITLLAGTLDRASLAALYRCCDAYVSLHRAEGFGRTLAEAMLTGKPVVATNWSGSTDFLDRDTGCPVEFKLRPVRTGEYPHGEGQVWAEPDLRSAADWMRWLASDWSRAAALGRAARRRILDQHGAAAVGARYAERLQALSQDRLDSGALHEARRSPAPAPRRSRRAAAG